MKNTFKVVGSGAHFVLALTDYPYKCLLFQAFRSNTWVMCPNIGDVGIELNQYLDIKDTNRRFELIQQDAINKYKEIANEQCSID